MNPSQRKRALQLGEPQGTAANRLRKQILYSLLRQTDQHYCYQCSLRIDGPEELSIEHKIPWLDSSDPKALFFDLANIAFSHLVCNIGAGRRVNQKYFSAEDRVEATRQQHAATVRRNYTPEKRRTKYLTKGY